MFNSGRLVVFLSVIITIAGTAITILLLKIPEEHLKTAMVIYSIVSWLLIIGIVFLFLHIDQKDDEIKILERDIKSETKQLWKHYNELSRFERNKSLREYMNIFLKDNEYVVGIQRYDYSVTKTSPLKIIFKINYEDGIVREHEDINAMVQSYYKFNKIDLIKFKKAIIDAMKHEKLDNLNDFLKDSKVSIEKKQIDELTDTDALTLSLSQLALSHLEKRFSVTSRNHLLKDEYMKALNRKKRLGIIRSIINYEILNGSPFFSFGYTGDDDSKSLRRYMTYIVKSERGEKFLFLITINTDEDWDPYLENKHFNDIINKFRKGLVKSGMTS
ncbi:hypothetical protein [Bacillus sp. UNC438CL73TsuS30]|uniref:hypothetical protein n=1 Tax=Bacillus sp. UNC438CL73TsuS30 TaxID=1340434 RepID=UPI00047B27A5|nr:hypothetical protein [Bacillus sp. UNC438CL73TsuS30]